MKTDRALYPFLFAAYPALALWAHNIQLTAISETLLPLGLSLLLAALIMLSLKLLRNPHKRALLTWWMLILFYGFGPLRDAVDETTLLGLAPARLTVLLWFLLLLLPSLLLLRSKKSFRAWTILLNNIGIVLLTVPLLGVLPDLLSDSGDDSGREHAAAGGSTLASRPDIYYIVLDGYARADILERLYHFDNSAFLDSLGARGFFVASDARTNYVQTLLSMSSSLNMCYLDSLAAVQGPDSRDRRPLREALVDNRVAGMLRGHGYRYVSYATGYTGTEFRDADEYRAPPLFVSEFQSLLLDFTPIPFLFRQILNQYDLHRRLVSYVLDDLGRPRPGSEPEFVLAHLVSPHPPFIFDAQGGPVNDLSYVFYLFDADHLREYISTEQYVDYYRAQLAYINTCLLAAVDRILQSSEGDPIIILQSDHGPASRLTWEQPEISDMSERVANFSALYVPDPVRQQLYPSLTPVNTFRILCGHLLQADLPLLDDRSYFSTWRHPYQFQDVSSLMDELAAGRDGAAPERTVPRPDSSSGLSSD